MRTRFTWIGIIAILILGISIFFVGCKEDDLNAVVQYHGQVVYINTTNPFPDLTVKVTDGKNTHCQTQTDAGGMFKLLVHVDEIDGNYYLQAGDSTCIPKKVNLGGYGQEEVDLGVIEVEGPALPTVKTQPIIEVTAESATLGGIVETDGRLTVTARGVCYSTEQHPTIDKTHTTDGSGIGEFTSNLKELEHNTIYYARAYATNRMGTAYGEQVKFTTELGVAVVVTDSVIRITAHSAKCKGHVESDGGFAVTKRGTCWSKKPDPTIDDDCTDDGSGIGEFTSTLKDLTEDTKYYVRTYATNSTTTTYGEQIIITTLDGLAVVKTDSVGTITATGFTAYGTVVSDCDIPVTARGFCYSTNQYPTLEDDFVTIGKGLGSYQGNIRNLQIGTTYYIRAYATNETGTTYGKQIQVTTKDGLPIVVTQTTNSTATTIYIQGEITESWGYDVSERGFVYSQLVSEPTTDEIKINTGKGKGQFNTVIKNLLPETKYYVRAYAINENGTSYGKVVQITTTDGKASITIGNIEDIKSVTAKSLVTVTDLGGASTLESCGLCWSTNPNPTIEDSVFVVNGKQVKTGYSCYLSKLKPNTTYYVRAFATTEITTNYSTQKTFTTKDGKATVMLGNISDITAQSATSNVTVTDLGGASALESCGLCWSIYPNPTIEDSVYVANGKLLNTSYAGYMSKLSLNTTYYVRAFATTDITTNYSTQQTFTTKDGLPTIITTSIGDNVTASTAISGGQVVDDGGFNVTTRGVCWSTFPYPTIADNITKDGAGIGYFSSSITGINLQGNITYYVRAYATNVNGTAYGKQVVVSNENYNYKKLPTIEYGGYTYRIYPDNGASYSYTNAQDYCANFSYAGYNDWSLPTYKELKYIMENYKNGWQCEDGSDFVFISSDNPSKSKKPKESAYYWCSEGGYGYRFGVTHRESLGTYYYYHIVQYGGSSVIYSAHIRLVRKYKE